VPDELLFSTGLTPSPLSYTACNTAPQRDTSALTRTWHAPAAKRASHAPTVWIFAPAADARQCGPDYSIRVLLATQTPFMPWTWTVKLPSTHTHTHTLACPSTFSHTPCPTPTPRPSPLLARTGLPTHHTASTRTGRHRRMLRRYHLAQRVVDGRGARRRFARGRRVFCATILPPHAPRATSPHTTLHQQTYVAAMLDADRHLHTTCTHCHTLPGRDPTPPHTPQHNISPHLPPTWDRWDYYLPLPAHTTHTHLYHPPYTTTTHSTYTPTPSCICLHGPLHHPHTAHAHLHAHTHTMPALT